MKSKDQDTRLMTFLDLHLLWLRFCPGNVRAVDDQDEDPMVQLDCPHQEWNPELCDEGHHVRFSGFLLLEEVEGTFDTALQNVLTVHTWDLEEPRLSALASKITRQQKNVAPFKVWSIKLQTEKSAEAFKTFINICPNFTENLFLEGQIGGRGWEILAEAMQLQPGVVKNIDTPKNLFGEASKKTLRAIWEAMGPNEEWTIGDPVIRGVRWVAHFLEKEKRTGRGWSSTLR